MTCLSARHVSLRGQAVHNETSSLARVQPAVLQLCCHRALNRVEAATFSAREEERIQPLRSPAPLGRFATYTLKAFIKRRATMNFTTKGLEPLLDRPSHHRRRLLLSSSQRTTWPRTSIWTRPQPSSHAPTAQRKSLISSGFLV